MFSHSKISTYKMCPKMYEYKYIQKLVPIGESNNLFIGKILHKGVELKDNAQLLDWLDSEYSTVSDKNETDIALALGMVDGYFERFGMNEIVHNELYFKIPFGDTEFEGYIDGLIEDENGYWLLEIKTASRIDKDYMDKLKFNDQITRYYYVTKENHLQDFKLDKPLLGIKYRIIKKPQIRQKMNESIMEFRTRLVEKLQEEGYIEEVVFTKSDAELEDVMKDTLCDIETIEKACRYTKCLTACSTFGRCPYMELCSKEENAELLYINKEEREGDKNVT